MTLAQVIRMIEMLEEEAVSAAAHPIADPYLREFAQVLMATLKETWKGDTA